MPIYKTDRRKDGKQQYRVRINYTDKDGNHRQIERIAYGYDEARDLERQLQIQYCLSMQALGQLTFGEFFEEYIKYKQHENRETSIDKCRQIIRNHIIPYFGSAVMIDITPRQIADWKNELNKTELGITMKQHCYSQLHAVFSFALRIDAIHENPTNKIENFKNAYFTMPEEKLQYYTINEFTKFSRTAKASICSPFQWSVYTFFCIAYFSGMRKGEIHALKWSDIEGDCIHVRRSISQKIAGKKIVEAPPKNKSSFRTLQIPEPLKLVLKEEKSRQQRQFSGWTEDFRVCRGDRCLSDTSISNYNKRWAEAAGLHVIRIHDYRHSHASLLANEGINIQEIARRLGHSNVQITWQRYSHLYPREEERAVAILNRVEL